MMKEQIVTEGPVSLHVSGKKVGEFAQVSLQTIDHSATHEHMGIVETRGVLRGLSAMSFAVKDIKGRAPVTLGYRQNGHLYKIDGFLDREGNFVGSEPEKVG